MPPRIFLDGRVAGEGAADGQRKVARANIEAVEARLAQISSTFSRPSGVSIIAKTRVVASASAGTGPTRSAERMGP